MASRDRKPRPFTNAFGLLSQSYSTAASVGLALDFVSSETLDGRITAAGGANGTRVNSAGIIVSATCPRFDYDPSTLAAKGLLIEEARTNLALQSADVSNATWSKTNGTATQGGTTAPDNSANGNSFVENTSVTVFHSVKQTYTKAASALTYTYSVYLKDKGREVEVRLTDTAGSNGTVMRVKPSNGTITAAAATFGAGFTSASGTFTAFNNGWYRATLTVTSDTGTTLATECALHNGTTNTYTGDGSSGTYIWGHELEQAPFATSYIPTTTTTVTRTGDNLSISGTGFTSWYNQAGGTLYAEFDTNQAVIAATTQIVVALEVDNDGNNRQFIFLIQTTPRASGNSFSGGNNQGRIDSGSSGPTAGVPVKAAMAFAVNDRAISADGAAVGTSATCTLQAYNTMYIGSDTLSSSWLNGHVRKIQYLTTRVSNALLQTMTT